MVKHKAKLCCNVNPISYCGRCGTNICTECLRKLNSSEGFGQLVFEEVAGVYDEYPCFGKGSGEKEWVTDARGLHYWCRYAKEE